MAQKLVRRTPDRAVGRARALAVDAVVFLGKTLYPHNDVLHPGVYEIATGKCNSEEKAISLQWTSVSASAVQ